MKDRDHIFLILEVKETFQTIHVQKDSMEVKKGGMLSASSLFARIHLG